MESGLLLNSTHVVTKLYGKTFSKPCDQVCSMEVDQKGRNEIISILHHQLTVKR